MVTFHVVAADGGGGGRVEQDVVVGSQPLEGVAVLV